MLGRCAKGGGKGDWIVCVSFHGGARVKGGSLGFAVERDHDACG